MTERSDTEKPYRVTYLTPNGTQRFADVFARDEEKAVAKVRRYAPGGGVRAIAAEKLPEPDE